MIKYDNFSKIIASCQHPFVVVEQAPEFTAPDLNYAQVWRDNSNRWCCLSRLDGVFFPCLLTASSEAKDFQRAFSSGKDALFLSPNGDPLALVDTASFACELLKEVNRSHAFLEGLLHTVDEMVVAVDENGKVDAFNDSAEKTYGIKGTEIIGHPISSFFTNLEITKLLYNPDFANLSVRDMFHQPMPGADVLLNLSPVSIGERTIGAVSAERLVTDKGSADISTVGRRTGGPDAFEKIYGRSEALNSVIGMAKRVAGTDISILLTGESGTGKELFAEAIHRAGNRRNEPFVVINCGAIPASLFESELFGYQPGSFTGADKRGRRGKFEEANHGTIFLDEIGELSLDMQVKLLRVLQNQRFYRVGGGDPINVDVRVISATNRDLDRMIEEGTFRDDLYYRINVVSLELPPLRNRREDISQLVYLFVREFCAKLSIPVKHIDPEVITCLTNYSWPGNIRELRNVVEGLVVLSEDNISVDNLPAMFKYKAGEIAGPDEEITESLVSITDRAEKDIIIQAIEKCGGDRSRAAKLLGIPRSTLYYKLKKYGIIGRARKY